VGASAGSFSGFLARAPPRYWLALAKGANVYCGYYHETVSSKNMREGELRFWNLRCLQPATPTNTALFCETKISLTE
jgi:hypothetical protein